MPDPMLILGATAAAGVVAAVLMLLSVGPARQVAAAPSAVPARRSALATCAEVLAVAGGMTIGCWWLGIRPSSPPVEDKDRLLFVLLPAAGVVEILAAVLQRRPWFGRILRLLLALPLPFLLLFGSGWLPSRWTPGGDPAAPSTWTEQEALRNLVGLGALLAGVWGLLVWAAQRAGGFVVPAALGLISATAGATIMLSGYATGGMIGLPFAGVAAGALLVCLLFARRHSMTGLVGVGTVLLFGLLMAGEFFGELTTTNFALLIAAPVVCGLIALPPLQKLKAAVRFVVVLVAALVPAGVAVGLAQRSFAAATDESSMYDGAGGSDAPAFGGTPSGAAAPTPATEPASSTTPKSPGIPRDPGADEPGAGAGPQRGSAPIDPGAESKN
jgi:hypothetical protein